MLDNPAGASPICGPAVLTNLIRKKETYSNAERRSSPLYEPPRNSVASSSTGHLSLFNSRSSYEELSDDYRSHEETVSSSGSDKSEGDILSNPVSLFPQFNPSDKETSDDKKAPSQRTQNRPRTSSWSSTLAAVTEETSFDDTSRDASSEQLPQSSTDKSIMDPPQAEPERPYETPPEKKEMLKAMRNLILKQQTALTELADQNTHYRKKIGDYQSKLIEMKEDAVNQQARIDRLVLEKEASFAECLWLREEMRALRLDKEAKTTCVEGDKKEVDSPDNTNDRDGLKEAVQNDYEDGDYDDEDDSLQIRFRDLMKPFIESPASSRQAFAPDSPVSAAPTNNESSIWEDAIPVPESVADHSEMDQPDAFAGLVATTRAPSQEPKLVPEQAADENTSSPFGDCTIGSTNKSTDNIILTNNSSSSDVSKGTAPTTTSSWSSGLPSRSREEAREEMAQYKRRLQSIQQKRLERRGTQKYSKPVVRFGVLGA